MTPDEFDEEREWRAGQRRTSEVRLRVRGGVRGGPGELWAWAHVNANDTLSGRLQPASSRRNGAGDAEMPGRHRGEP